MPAERQVKSVFTETLSVIHAPSPAATMLYQVAALVLLMSGVQPTPIPLPMKLLRVPKIYNALITSNQKLVPSEAMPASTGPVFQPLPLTGDPILLNPEALTGPSDTSSMGEAPRPFSKNTQPLTFYPKFSVYHQLPQTVFPFGNIYQPPPIVVPITGGGSSTADSANRMDIFPAAENVGSSEDVPTEKNETPRGGVAFVTNNGPANSNIPNVPPPPPPIPTSSQTEESE